MPAKQEILSELEIGAWIESFRRSTAHIRGARGPLNPNEPGAVHDVVPGPFAGWHYVFFGLLRALEKIDEQQTEIESLRGRIGLLEKMSIEE